MRIVKPYARMLPPAGAGDPSRPFTVADGRELLRVVEWAGRISHRSEEAQTDDSFRRFLQAVVIDKGDWSIVEHCQVGVDAVVDRGITHEIVRHRIGAYTQESTRFVNYEKKMPPAFIYPEVGTDCPYCLSGIEPELSGTTWHHRLAHHVSPATSLVELGMPTIAVCAYRSAWLRAIAATESAYRSLLADGWAPQLARSVFPNALASRIVITYNLRNWRHFFLMRTSKEAHPQMREVTIPLLRQFQERIPILYEDIQPDERQIANLRRGR